MNQPQGRAPKTSVFGAVVVGSAMVAGLAQGCGDSGATTGTGGGMSSGSTTGNGTTVGSSTTNTTAANSTTTGKTTATATSVSTTTTATASSTSTGGPAGCMTAALGSTRGSAIALTSDDSRLITVNRDAGSVTIFTVDKTMTPPTIAKLAELSVGGEPWQVAINGCGDTAYVVLRKDQKLVEITNLDTTPAVGRTVAVGSEPTSLAITPHNTKIYVSNWVDGTLSVVDPITMTVAATVDLNPTIAATNLLGTVTPRPALAHPRGVAVTNKGGATDDAEDVYVTEWYAVRTAPENAAGTNADHNWKGLLYKVNVAVGAPSAIDLPPVMDTGFIDVKGQHTGCFPNQVAAVTVDNGFAYVTSTCASPAGPVGVIQRGACTTDGQCSAFGTTSVCKGGGSEGGGVCTDSCATDADCGALAATGDCVIVSPDTKGTCKAQVNNAKTTTHPGLTIVDLSNGSATTNVLDQQFATQAATNAFPFRSPLLPSDVGFKNSFAYVTAQGADAAFRLTTQNGSITAVGSANNNFIDLRTTADATIRLPIGIAVSNTRAVAFVANDGNRDVAVLDLNAQAVSTAATTYSTPLPAAGSPELSQLRGKRFFTTGLGRWSLKGQGWGSCAACHFDGLSDNVTWYFARGPRQTISVDGSFSKADPNDHRAFNWNGVADEIADLETNVRGVSGGVGAIVSTVSTPPVPADRININTTAPPQSGLQGSSDDTANPNGTSSTTPHSVIGDWMDVGAWARTIRSPRAPSNLDAIDVAAGQAIFTDPTQGNCIGCHSGSKWTISKVFYTPSNIFNDATPTTSASSLSNTSWNAALNGFPAGLFPSTTNQLDRVGAAPGFEQLGCLMRPVGTIGTTLIPSPNNAAVNIPSSVSPAAVGVIEVRQDMVTGGQGSGLLTGEPTKGFNPPALLGLSVGAPFFHAGNARTLEETFDPMFQGHFQSPVAAVFNPNATQVKQLVAFLLSIDGGTTTVAVPAKGNTGGDICVAPQ